LHHLGWNKKNAAANDCADNYRPGVGETEVAC